MSIEAYLHRLEKVSNQHRGKESFGYCLFFAIPTITRLTHFHLCPTYVEHAADPFDKPNDYDFSLFFQWLIDHEDLLVYDKGE